MKGIPANPCKFQVEIITGKDGRDLQQRINEFLENFIKFPPVENIQYSCSKGEYIKEYRCYDNLHGCLIYYDKRWLKKRS